MRWLGGPRTGRRAASIASALVLASCGGGSDTTSPGGAQTSAPTPGTLTVTLTGAPTPAEALVVTLTGPTAPTNVREAGPAYTVFARGADTTARVAVFGAAAPGALLRFDVPDTKQAARYRATVVEVADSTNAVRAPTGFDVAIAP
jgi:hypothetical protein